MSTDGARRGMLATSILSAGEVARRFRADGWAVGVVSGPRSSAEALDAIGRALDFPDYYGRNLDALWDCLTDLTGPTALIWDDWEPFALLSLEDWSPILTVLTNRIVSELGGAFSVVFIVRAPAPAPDADEDPVAEPGTWPTG